MNNWILWYCDPDIAIFFNGIPNHTTLEYTPKATTDEIKDIDSKPYILNKELKIKIQYKNETSTIISTYYCHDSLEDIKKALRDTLVDNKVFYRERELRAIKDMEEMKKYCSDYGAVLNRISDVFKVRMYMEIKMPF